MTYTIAPDQKPKHKLHLKSSLNKGHCVTYRRGELSIVAYFSINVRPTHDIKSKKIILFPQFLQSSAYKFSLRNFYPDKFSMVVGNTDITSFEREFGTPFTTATEANWFFTHNLIYTTCVYLAFSRSQFNFVYLAFSLSQFMNHLNCHLVTSRVALKINLFFLFGNYIQNLC